MTGRGTDAENLLSCVQNRTVPAHRLAHTLVAENPAVQMEGILEQETKANFIEESTKDKLVQAVEQLNRLERLGSRSPSNRQPTTKSIG